ncbi:uncharacterized protein LOC125902838 [Epinephelus fuscoguttatus]|uniref:uncharacterized protein LOC125902838 n=1 Tax=Epinephelus fuscoguttatus TaxID=293821 RepID=UPI0020D05D53|nr:uncharacterized protein LOC125902838 [Epinephelus fuscoguttatus]
MDSPRAKNAVEQILTSKPAGMTVIKEYEETGSLKDSGSYILEHFYDIQSNKGFLEWRVKTVQRQSRTTSTSHNRVALKGGPTSSRTFGSTDDQQTGDDCMEAMSLLHHTTDRDLVFQKMKETFQYCQQMLPDPQQSADILQMFPRFLDTKGLILQDFLLMFGPETASRFLGKWDTGFKDKVIREARTLRETSLLKKTADICPE